ncbi:hypothetical protein PR048_032602 [Dryococelus australis]|uniref:Uncharacterized protein n=1 Tax=Dryococelus australis TaxID=614101 RepID=A0ABQ9G5I5_9NEOP|nr:hypothetical protein PR048_032602 [Dryococelus australis]
MYRVRKILKCGCSLQARGTMKRKETRKVLTHHLYFCMRDFGHHVGEDTEIYFSLYDTKKAKYIRLAGPADMLGF